MKSRILSDFGIKDIKLPKIPEFKVKEDEQTYLDRNI